MSHTISIDPPSTDPPSTESGSHDDRPSGVAPRDESTPGAWTRFPLPLALTVAAYLGTQQAEVLLHQFQQSGTRAYGVGALGGGWPARPDEAAAAVTLWNGFESATAREAAAFLIGYTIVDLVLIVSLVWLLSAAGRRIANAYPSDDPRLDLLHQWNRNLVWDRRASGVKRLRPLGYFALFDVVEDVVRLITYDSGGGTAPYLVAFLAEKAKFVALLIVLLALVAGFHEGRTRHAGWGRLGTSRREALVVLRGQLALVLVFAALMLVDVTGQVGDLVRRWTDTPSAGMWGAGTLVLLAGAMWVGARRTWAVDEATDADADEPDDEQASDVPGVRSVHVVALLVATVAAAAIVGPTVGSSVIWALPIVVALVLVLDVLASLIRWRDHRRSRRSARLTTAEARSGQPDHRKEALLRAGAFLAALPVAVTGIALVKASIGPLILASTSVGTDNAITYSPAPAGVLFLLGLLTLAAGAVGVPRLVRELDSDPDQYRTWLPPVLAVVLLGFVAAMLWRPVTVPLRIGSIAVVAIAFAVLAMLFAELQRFSEMRVPPLGLALLGFKRTPVFLLLGAWFALAAMFPSVSGHHDVRHHPIAGIPAGPGDPVAGRTDADTDDQALAVPLVDVWESWLDQNCVRTRTEPVPIAFVIAHGGGIRAAYWTGSVMTTLLADADEPVPARTGEEACPTATARSRIFAVSSISGGSVGAAAYLSQDQPSDTWYDDALGAPDYSAVALARGLFVDLPRSVIGFDARDRAAMLEEAWEDRIPGFGEDYFTHLRPGIHPEPDEASGTVEAAEADEQQWMPVTMLNSAQAETGCQVNTSAVRLTAPSTTLEDAGDCRSVLHRYRTLRLDVPDDPQTAEDDATPMRVPAAAVTVDTVAVMGADSCRLSVPTSTAALMSARWPYISPSGRLPCGPPWVSTIDGGYADNAGYAGFSALWDQVAPLIARHNASEESRGWVVPVLVVVDNHYQSLARAAEPPRIPQLLVPPLGYQRAGGTRGPGREQGAVSSVALSPPGLAVDCTVPAYDPDGADRGEPQRGRVVLAPSTRPGLPAPLAWTLAGSSRQDLDVQRAQLFADGVGASLRALLQDQKDAAITCG